LVSPGLDFGLEVCVFVAGVAVAAGASGANPVVALFDGAIIVHITTATPSSPAVASMPPMRRGQRVRRGGGR
jgi:hypothetical protein